ncbi:DMT family transporter [Actinoplanes sp. NPDC023714]|uniref:DMT family transporter n=1 Tax=Actinoplanes sp. NPDC023714 TaxID=3154322 RepID=UPI0033E83749
MAKDLTAAAGGVLVLLALRYLISAFAMLPVLAVRRAVSREQRARTPKRGLSVGLLLGLTQASVLAFETYGVAHTSATNAGVLISLTILLTPMLEGVAGRRWLPPRFFVAAGVAVGGVVLLVSGPGLAAPSIGDALILVAAVIRAAHVTLSGHPALGRNHDTFSLVTVQTVVGAVLFTAAVGPGLGTALPSYEISQWLAVTYLALGCSVFAFLVQLWAVRRTSAARASLLLGTEPVWAVLIGVGIGGEHLTPMVVAGVVLVLAGTVAGQRVEANVRLEQRKPIGSPGWRTRVREQTTGS